jgi:PPK2 family polyphosphate:nucleotide phosphotransferase
MSDRPDLRGALRVKPGTKVDLSKLDPGETHGHRKESAEQEISELLGRMAQLQDKLWAEQKHALLIVLQGIDASGKDGTIRRVMTAFNPQGCVVAGFKVPTGEELAHDFLWRIHKRTPGKGEIGIFNRSHYEQVLVVRVHDLEPKKAWSRHYEHIRNFETLLIDSGTTIVKFFLHISKDEQAERLQARLDDPKKRWKFQTADLDERKHWDAYEEAFEELLSETSTAEAPWYCIPANRKWYRDLVAATVLVETLKGMDLRWPTPPDLDGIVIE